MNPWMTVLLAVVSSGVLTTAVTAIFNRRNLGATTERTEAEREQIVTETARGLVGDLRAEVARLIARIGELERAAEDQRRVLILHSAWDLMAGAKVRECSPPVDLPDPPPLTPPRRATRFRPSPRSPPTSIA